MNQTGAIRREERRKSIHLQVGGVYEGFGQRVVVIAVDENRAAVCERRLSGGLGLVGRIGQPEFQDAMERIVAGPERQGNIITTACPAS